jgi:integrase
MENLFKNKYGSVKPYTRHSSTCPKAAEDNSCRCPKWLYVFTTATKKKRRYTLNTPSWADAVREASDVLKGLDPEIAAARKKTRPTGEEALSVKDALQLWVTRTENKLGKDSSTLGQYKLMERLITKWATAQGIKYPREITPAQLAAWYGSDAWTQLAPTTRRQRWGVLRVMFLHMVRMKVLGESPAANIEASEAPQDHVQGPYSDGQMAEIAGSLANAEAPTNIRAEDRASYVARLEAFMHLLIESGCDVSDAIQFTATKLGAVKLGRKVVHVFRYKRQKTGEEAVVPISSALDTELRKVPASTESREGMPFRTRGINLKADQNRWSRRVMRVVSLAGVTHVDLPNGDRKAANVKQLRHTAAVRWLRQGQRAEEVAKMLGHSDTNMVRKHYAPWVKDLDLAHITRVVSNW